MSFTRYKSLEDKVVLISGGASGIGESFVRAFAANGARVAFLDLQQDAGAALAKELAGSKHAPLFLHCDITDTTALKAAIREANQKLGPASVMVNNAANDQRQHFADVTPDELDQTLAVNFRHVYFACQAVVPQMIAAGGGSIVNMSSMAWIAGAPNLAAYASAKAAIVGLTIRSPARWGRTASGSTRSRPARCSPIVSASCGFRARRRSRRPARRNVCPT